MAVQVVWLFQNAFKDLSLSANQYTLFPFWGISFKKITLYLFQAMRFVQTVLPEGKHSPGLNAIIHILQWQRNAVKSDAYYYVLLLTRLKPVNSGTPQFSTVPRSFQLRWLENGITRLAGGELKHNQSFGSIPTRKNWRSIQKVADILHYPLP